MEAEKLRCLVCSKNRSYNVEFHSIVTNLPNSKKPAEEVLLKLTKLMDNVRFKVPIGACFLCVDCFNDMVEYDAYVMKLLEIQRRLGEKLKYSRFGRDSSDYAEYEDVDKTGRQSTSFEDTLNAGTHIAACNLNDECELLLGDIDIEELSREVKNEIHPFLKCPHCDKLFENKTRLKYHTDSEHKRMGHCECTVCGMRVKDEEYLDLHMNLHEGKTENECRHCSKRYTRKVNVIRHMQKHWNNMKFQCEKCGLRFSETTVLYNHKLQHEAEEQPLICDICQQSFKTKRTYRGHMLTHRKDRPRFNCIYCGKTFVEKYTLKVHMRVHQDFDGPCEKRTVSISSAKHSAKEMLVCIICSCNLSSKELYNQHMEQQHDVILKRTTSYLIN